ncbi:MAG: dihydropteroate synthase [Verrucomicrobia subdivision 6 bacterium BACL9 MAG-120924-bin69]|jgi:dihydropteroate synthase|uniref:Dihydropteroate synthase n=2 Tax=Verrucomicrobia subdivision 6 TaxID=134627 RepID=A0A0R2RKP1_9BACT|nr:MAG: dihydropteroate synthase [Verrucomicrobia subdivision 6 bacterium BACL9 MAG-120507-bin52]KRP34147.1 MAG: dihydropteroate synthase [Verrucomicrobia subdivision 6 bacterium BACL9 MAG-120924-bin69]
MLSLESLTQLAQKHAEALPAQVAEFEIRGHRFHSASRPHLMGVINLSPDSWYRESVILNTDAALVRARRLRAEGADLVDLGAESSLHHAARVDPAQQIATLLPILKPLAQEGSLISIETYQPVVARRCLEAGAAVLNLTGTRPHDDLYKAVADHKAGIILCYVQGEHVRAVGDFVHSPDHATALLDYFRREIDRAVHAGVHAIWIDPGLGFYYKNLQDSTARIRYQAETFLHSFRLRTLGWPVCQALPHAFEFFQDEVRSAESLFAVLALLGKTDLLRTHEIPKVRAVARTLGILA